MGIEKCSLCESCVMSGVAVGLRDACREKGFVYMFVQAFLLQAGMPTAAWITFFNEFAAAAKTRVSMSLSGMCRTLHTVGIPFYILCNPYIFLRPPRAPCPERPSSHVGARSFRKTYRSRNFLAEPLASI